MPNRLFDLALVALTAAYFSGTAALFYHSPYLLTLLGLPVPFILAARLGEVKMALVFVLTGCVAGPVTETICTAGGLWCYAETGGLPYIPLWLLPGWASFPPALLLISRGLLGRPFKCPARPLYLVLALTGLAAEIALFVILGHSTPQAMAVAIPFALLLLALTRRLETLIFIAAGALLGPLVEALPIAAGGWSYARPEFLGLAGFMPLAYGIFGVLTIHAAHNLAALILRPGFRRHESMNNDQ